MEMHQNSLDAYTEIREIKGECRKKVHDMIRKHRAITAKEIAKKLGWEINCVTPRICELRDIGAIVEGGNTKNENGFNVTLYAPVDRGGVV